MSFIALRPIAMLNHLFLFDHWSQATWDWLVLGWVTPYPSAARCCSRATVWLNRPLKICLNWLILKHPNLITREYQPRPQQNHSAPKMSLQPCFSWNSRAIKLERDRIFKLRQMDLYWMLATQYLYKLRLNICALTFLNTFHTNIDLKFICPNFRLFSCPNFMAREYQLLS